MAAHNDYSTGATAFFIGAIVGGGAALLLAPQSGEKTRRQIRYIAENTLDDLAEKGQEALDMCDTVWCKGIKIAKAVRLV